MNKEDTIYADNSGSPERVFQDHKKLKDAIWEVYPEHLKAAQKQDIILPSTLNSRSSCQRLQSSRVCTEADQTEDTVQVSDREVGSDFPDKELVIITEASSTTGMDSCTNRSISPQLNDILDSVVNMEYEDNLMVFSSVLDTQPFEDRKKSYINTGKVINSINQKKKTNTLHDVNQNYNMKTLAQTDEDKEEISLNFKRQRLPGIEQVINKTSFANQRSDYYSRIPACDGNDAAYGAEVAQQLSDQRLLNPQVSVTTSPTCSLPTREGVHYPNQNSLPGRPTVSRQTGAPESFNTSNELMETDSQGCRNGSLLNPSVSKPKSWTSENISRGTPSLTSTLAQFQNNGQLRQMSGMLDLGISHVGQTFPSANSTSKSLNRHQYQKNKTHFTGDCLPVPDGTLLSQMENVFPPNAMVMRADPSCPLLFNYKPTLIKESDYQKNHYHPSNNAFISSPMAPPNPNQTSMHLGNVNAQKLGLSTMTPSPTFSPNEGLSSYGTINAQGQQNSKYVFAASTTTGRQEFIQQLTGQTAINPCGVNLQSVDYGPKNSELITQQGFPAKSKPQWSGSYDNASTPYKNLQGLPTPITTSRVQEFSSSRIQEHSSVRRQDLPSTRHLQFTPSSTQQFPSSCTEESPYSFNKKFHAQELPSTWNKDFSPPQGQFAASRHELHSSQVPQKISGPTPSTSAMDFQMLNSTGPNQYGPATKNYITKAPRKKRVTKGISVAQTKRIQKKRKQVEEKLFEYLRNENCDHKTSVIIKKHLYHVQSCPSWLSGEDCPLCNQICEMLMHASECQNLNCVFIYCGIKALTVVAETFSQPKFVYTFLRKLNVSEEDMNDIYVLKNWKEKPTAD
ncbi:unnamed protein product [Nezara viridula]|uniref:Uncharacterized protein n=1 Tax=Nezara viridula TaxID=85310 RepID=A0A9P0MV34_NEZVI|nr:unnamed protein product [Nezara viridula]